MIGLIYHSEGLGIDSNPQPPRRKELPYGQQASAGVYLSCCEVGDNASEWLRGERTEGTRVLEEGKQQHHKQVEAEREQGHHLQGGERDECCKPQQPHKALRLFRLSASHERVKLEQHAVSYGRNARPPFFILLEQPVTLVHFQVDLPSF